MIGSHCEAQHARSLFGNVIFAAGFDIVYRQGFAIEDFAPKIKQYLPSSEFLARKRRQGGSASMGATSVKEGCITEQHSTLFEGERGPFQKILGID